MTSSGRTAAGLSLGAVFAWAGAVLGERAVVGTFWRVEPQARAGDPSSVEGRASRISSDVLLFTPKVGSEPSQATFRGFLWTEANGPVQFRLRGDTPGRLWLDDALVLPASGGERSDRATLDLRQGNHRLVAAFDSTGKLPVFRVTVAGGDADDVDPILFSSPPGALDHFVAGRLIPGFRIVGRILGCAAAALGVWWVLGLPAAPIPSPGGGTVRARVRVGACALAIVAYAGLLRIESVVRQHWGLDAPGWARYLTEMATELRPAVLKQGPAERPYFGDPTTYLRFAREMERFYDAHVREPLFVAATRLGLRWAGDRDVGISLTSAFFSTLLVGATFLMGARAFGPGVGLVAALLLAVERDAIGLAALGWRDDSFAFWVAAFTASLLALLAGPSFGRALTLGGIAGAAALTRITALSFLLPALAFALWTSRREAPALRRLALSVVITATLVIPFLLTSRIATGDALHAINAHTRFYRSRALLPAETEMSWNDYLWRSFGPAELLQNLASGLTVHPFDNKWQPFAIWARPAPLLLRGLSVVGLVLFLRRRNGRLLLVVLLSALLPFAFTFRISGGNEWRFTLLAYPFYLVAAAWALQNARAWVQKRLDRGRSTPPAGREEARG